MIGGETNMSQIIKSPQASVGVERSFSRRAWNRFKKNKLALLGLGVILVLIILAVFAPIVSPYNPFTTVRNELGLANNLQPPSSSHLLGTDNLGRDIFSRMIFAGRISLSVGLVSVSIACTIGIILGALAGYFGKWVDSLIMRVTDVVICFPVLFLVITVSTMLKPNIFNVMAIIGLVYWTRVARMVRGEILKVRELDFIQASRALGARDLRIIGRHVLPNIMAPLLVQATLLTAQAILIEASLSFLGVGVQQPTPSWGNMLNAATSITILGFRPWVWIPPGLAILITVLSINFIGDGLRDALDPKLEE